MKIVSCHYCDELTQKDKMWFCPALNLFLCGVGSDPIPSEKCIKTVKACNECINWNKNYMGLLSCKLRKENKRYKCESWDPIK